MDLKLTSYQYYIYKKNIIAFVIGVIISISLNHLNLLAYNFNHLYLSPTLVYAALIGAANTVWSYQLVRYLSSNKFDSIVFIVAASISLVLTILMRSQYFVDDIRFIKRMISHDSTALTTSDKILEKTTNPRIIDFANSTKELISNRINQMETLLNELNKDYDAVLNHVDTSDLELDLKSKK